MRAALLVVTAAACGSSAPPQHEAGVYGPASLAQQEPAKPPPPPPPPSPLLARLPIHDGAVPGFDAYTIGHRADPNHCGGIAITVARVAGKPIAPGDEALAAAFELAPPTGLDFSPEHKEASMTAFNAWIAELTKRGGAAMAHYQEAARSGDPHDKAAALARVAQVDRHYATMLARLELPLDIRTGDFVPDKITAFCDTVANAAEPLLKRAEELEQRCAEITSTGWWTPVCATASSARAPSP